MKIIVLHIYVPHMNGNKLPNVYLIDSPFTACYLSRVMKAGLYIDLQSLVLFEVHTSLV